MPAFTPPAGAIRYLVVPPPEPPTLYQDVEIYDVLHAPGTSGEVTGLSRMARRFIGAPAARGTWLEPACGTGRYLRTAAARGIRCIGFDNSPEMVQYARMELAALRRRRPTVPRARIFQADMTDFAPLLGRARAHFAFNLINTIRHLPSDTAVLNHLEQITAALRPRGVYAVGLSTTIYNLEGPSEDVWEGHRGPTRVKQVVQYIPPEGAPRNRWEQVHSHLVIRRGTKEEHRDSKYLLRSYTRRQWERLIARSAMEVIAVVDEDGTDLDPPQIGYGIWILRSRTTPR
jgi:cyclopropane fatty-acyl-phospholipid synthase-like methyltransferase